MEHFHITKTRLSPACLLTSLEIDKLVECRKGQFIGIACKRTLREYGGSNRLLPMFRSTMISALRSCGV